MTSPNEAGGVTLFVAWKACSGQVILISIGVGLTQDQGLGVNFGRAIVCSGGADRILSNAVTEVFTLISFRGETIDTNLSRFLAGATTATATAITPAARHWWVMLSNLSNLLALRSLISHFSRTRPWEYQYIGTAVAASY